MIKTIKIINNDYSHRHKDDVERIQQVIFKNGYLADWPDCANIWDEYSDMFAAGWLGLPEDDNELWDIIKDKVKNLCQN